MESLHQLMKKEAKWSWRKEKQAAFQKLKETLTSAHVLAYFSPKKSTGVIVGASLVGAAGMLMQEGKEICYMSRNTHRLTGKC